MNHMLYAIISILFGILEVALLVRVFLSWINIQGNPKWVEILYQVTEPILAPIRNLLNRTPLGSNSMFDFSPIVAFLLIGLIRNIITGILF